MDTHLGVKYVCKICNKEYSKQWSLKQHMYSHFDKKPFQCEFCSMDFIRKDKYDVHDRYPQHTHTHMDFIKWFASIPFAGTKIISTVSMTPKFQKRHRWTWKAAIQIQSKIHSKHEHHDDERCNNKKTCRFLYLKKTVSSFIQHKAIKWKERQKSVSFGDKVSMVLVVVQVTPDIFLSIHSFIVSISFSSALTL